MPAGYSGTPLVRKLGIRPGHRMAVIDPPAGYGRLLEGLPETVERLTPRARRLDVVHLFATRASTLRARLPRLTAAIARDGMIWVSWPKKASKVPTDVTEDVVRREALPLGLVDVKVCAVDDTWSGLKLVIRKELR
jgi:hypothetical protein